MQEGQLVRYKSRKLNEHEKNYVTHDLELAMIIHDLNMWRHYLLGRRFILMSDNSGLRYSFDQPNLNARKDKLLATINKFEFKIRYIKGKESKVADALSKRILVNHIATMISYGIDLQDQILQEGQQDDRYMELRHKLQQHGTYEHDVDYHLTVDALVTFRDRIYVSDNSELKNLSLREFHGKPYLGHSGYHKTLTTVKKFYYWPNLKKEVVGFMA